MKIQPKSEFSKNVLTLMTGTTIAQAIPIAISPILTRIYTPEDFGIFALYLSISSLVSVIVTGRYELAIMLPKKENDATNIVALSMLITIFISLFSSLIIMVFNHQISVFLESEEIGVWLYFIPISIFLTGVYQSLSYWHNRKKKYQMLGNSKIIKSMTSSSINIGMGIGSYGSGGLVLGNVMGQFASALILSKTIWKEKKSIKEVKKLKMIALARKYINFPKINMVHAFFDMAKGVSVNILLVKLYDTFILGQFYMVNKILLLPSSLIGASISQVLFRELSEKYNKKQDFSKIVLSLMIKLFLFALIPFFIIIFFSKPLFVFVFGEEWAVGGELASAFAPFILFHFVASPLSIIPLIVNKQKEAFYINLIGISIYVFSIIIGNFVFDVLLKSLWLLSISMSIYFLFLYSWIYKISKVSYHINDEGLAR